jgi:hypothetical protein
MKRIRAFILRLIGSTDDHEHRREDPAEALSDERVLRGRTPR